VDKKTRDEFRMKVLHLDKEIYEKFNIDSMERVIDKINAFKSDCDMCKELDHDMESLCNQVSRIPKMSKVESKKFNEDLIKIKKHLVTKHKQAYEGQYILTFFALGVGLGVAFGNAYGNLGVGIAIGIAVGMAVGNALDKKARQDNRVV